MERLNKLLVKILCRLISDHRRDWTDFVPKAVLAYNTSVHESTGCTPYRLMFGRKASSETQRQSVGSEEKAGRKFSSKGERAPGYRFSPSYFQNFKRMPAPDWAQKMLYIIVPNRRAVSAIASALAVSANFCCYFRLTFSSISLDKFRYEAN